MSWHLLCDPAAPAGVLRTLAGSLAGCGLLCGVLALITVSA
jgi:hypothetical protein